MFECDVSLTQIILDLLLVCCQVDRAENAQGGMIAEDSIAQVFLLYFSAAAL